MWPVATGIVACWVCRLGRSLHTPVAADSGVVTQGGPGCGRVTLVCECVRLLLAFTSANCGASWSWRWGVNVAVTTYWQGPARV